MESTRFENPLTISPALVPTPNTDKPRTSRASRITSMYYNQLQYASAWILRERLVGPNGVREPHRYETFTIQSSRVGP